MESLRSLYNAIEQDPWMQSLSNPMRTDASQNKGSGWVPLLILLLRWIFSDLVKVSISTVQSLKLLKWTKNKCYHWKDENPVWGKTSWK